MTLFIATMVLTAVCAAPLAADVTYVVTMSSEGGTSGVMAGLPPRTMMRIKGPRSRTDIDAPGQPSLSSITDLTARQMILLRHGQKVAVVTKLDDAAGSSQPGAATPTKAATGPTPTGRTRTIDGVTCDEHVVQMTFTMAELAAANSMGPDAAQAAAMMKDVRLVMKGSLWVAKAGPGVQDYVGFKKFAGEAGLAGVFPGLWPGGRQGGVGEFMSLIASAPGMPYVVELTTLVEGTGEVADMLRQQIGNSVVTTRVGEVSADSLADDVFIVPAGYRVVPR